MAVSSRESKELCSELDKIDSKFTQFESKLDTNLNQSSTILTEIQGISGQFDTILKLITDNHPMYQSNVQPGKLESIRIAIQTPTLDISSTPRIVMAVLNNRKIAIGSTTTGEYMSFKVNANSGNIEDLYTMQDVLVNTSLRSSAGYLLCAASRANSSTRIRSLTNTL